MYTDKNFKTKKTLKDAVSAYNLRMTEGKTEPQWFELHGVSARPVTFYSPGPFPAPVNGNVAIEGPHYPEPHKWYASCVAKDGVIVSVK